MNVFWLIALVNLVPVAAVVATSPLRGLSRVLAPDTLVVGMLYAIFAIRPLFTDRFQASRFEYSGFYRFVPTYDGQLTASLVGILLLWSIGIGALWCSHWRKLPAGPTTAGPEDRRTRQGTDAADLPHVRAVAVTLAALALYFALIVSFMGLARALAMSEGRSDYVSSGAFGLPAIVYVIPLTGSIAAATLILMARSHPIGFPAWLSILFCTALSLVSVSQLGNRRFMIPAVLIVVGAFLMQKPIRLRLWHAVAGLLAIIFLAVVPYVRKAGSRPGENLGEAMVRYIGDNGFVVLLRNMFTTYDTEMYDYIAVVAPRLENGRENYGFGSGTVLEFFLHPLPQNMFNFNERSSEVRSYLFNYGCGVTCDLPNPVSSLGGVLFFDGWYVGVIVGGALAGVLVRVIAMRWSRAATSSVAQNMVTAISASFMAIAVRTETVGILWLCIYSLMIGFLVLAVMGEGTILSKLRRSRDNDLSSVSSICGPQSPTTQGTAQTEGEPRGDFGMEVNGRVSRRVPIHSE